MPVAVRRNRLCCAEGEFAVVDYKRKIKTEVNGHVDSLARFVPTDDAGAALDFCRALAQVLKTASQPSPVVADVIEDVVNVPPDVSIVVPAFNEEGNLPVLYRRLVAALGPLDLKWELLFINDGSRDASADVIANLAKADARVTAVDLARNFGHQAAISAGLDHSRGRAVIIMDADLQDPPEELPRFIAHWREGYDVVYAVRRMRPENWLKRAAYSVFYRLLRRISAIPIPLDAGDFSLMDRRVVDLLESMPERNRFLRGMRSWVGLKQIGVQYDRGERLSGHTNYTLGRLIALALDGLFSFSFLPLRVISLTGLAVSALSIILALVYAVQKLVSGLEPAGFATIVVSVFFFSGVQLITLGVLGEYVGRIFEEVRRRPLYVVRQVVRREGQ